uniref:PDZ domain-containing protein n=1 Tax=Neogobius melanostomus TaxID=47308 RepID=A0A8C6UYQ2_9GOBI
GLLVSHKGLLNRSLSDPSPRTCLPWETLPGSKQGPPVAPKPAWFRQSLRKIREEQQSQKKPTKSSIDPPSSVSYSRSFGARNQAANTNLSIRQKIHSFETFSSPESPEKVIPARRPVAAPDSLPIIEKDTEIKESEDSEDVNANESIAVLSTEMAKDSTFRSYRPNRRPNGKAQNSTPAECSVMKGFEGESLAKILAFSNQVFNIKHGSTNQIHNNTFIQNLFACSLAQLRECSMTQGESSGAQSVLSVLPSEEIQQLIQEVQTLDQDQLKQLEDIHVVILHKEEGAGLGFTIAGGSDLENKAPTVHRVFPSGLAAQEGTIQKGDQVLSINGQSLSGATHSEATTALRQARTLSVAVVVICKRAEEEKEGSGEEITAEEGGQFTVKLDKGCGGVGFTLEGGRGSIHGDKPLVLNRIFTEQCGLQSGDEVLSVQGLNLQDMSRFEAWNYIKGLPEGVVTVTVRRQTQ